MKSVHLVIADLFLPEEFAPELCAELRLPALQKILARGRAINSGRTEALSLEDALCGLFAAPVPVASISAAFDGLGEGCWLRADPVHVRLQREQVVLMPNVAVSTDEAMQLCASLNAHFAGQGMEFFAPQPQRWYLRLDELPDITTEPLSQVAGRNIHGHLPAGVDASRWHQLFNEIQMLLFAHPLNEAREARGEVPVNSLWFWGNGCGAGQVPVTYDNVSSDEVLVEMLATFDGMPYSQWSPTWCGGDGRQLLVWTGLRAALQAGDLAAWRCALQQFETAYAQPLWQALRSGQIAHLQVDILGGDHLRQLHLTRMDAWAFWRRSKKLAEYSSASI
ncbi:MAG: hypothetical protein NTY60_04000 [Proteobacteria bacterium]|nr:hypothetical protein [Pseudomonadota bacterium]